MKFELDSYHRNVSDDDILNDIRVVAKKLDRSSLTARKYDDQGKFGLTTVNRRFGSWNKALAKAGLQIAHRTNTPVRTLFENLATVWEKLGRQPKYSEVRSPLSEYSVFTYEKRFGAWRRALEAFVDYMNSEGDTDSDIDTASEKNNVQFESQSSPRVRSARGANYRLRFLVMRRDSFRCVQCGKSPAIHAGVNLVIDHVNPWSKGGETVLENLQTLCQECNTGKSDLAAVE